MDASLSTNGHRGTLWQRHKGQLDVSVAKRLSHWSLQLKATDILRTGSSQTLSYGNALEYSRRCYADTQQVLFTAKYHFGTEKRTQTYEGTNAGMSERERM